MRLSVVYVMIQTLKVEKADSLSLFACFFCYPTLFVRFAQDAWQVVGCPIGCPLC